MTYDEKVEQEFLLAMKEMSESGRAVEVVMDCMTIMAVGSHLQLALRHPENRGPSTQLVARFIAELIARVQETDPMVAVLLDRGNDARFDTYRGASEVLTCVYCGQTYPPGTPPAQHEALYAHIKHCPKHPLAAALVMVRRLHARLSQIDSNDSAAIAAVEYLESMK